MENLLFLGVPILKHIRVQAVLDTFFIITGLFSHELIIIYFHSRLHKLFRLNAKKIYNNYGDMFPLFITFSAFLRGNQRFISHNIYQFYHFLTSEEVKR